MKVLIDTSVWSLALRRRRGDLAPSERGVTLLLSEVIQAGEALLIGPVRQEILSGIADTDIFESLRHYLRYFDEEALTADDFEEAARCYNRCKAKFVGMLTPRSAATDFRSSHLTHANV